MSSVPDGGPEAEAEGDGEDDLEEAEPLRRRGNRRHQPASLAEGRGQPVYRKKGIGWLTVK